jgi:hypothetical protein
MDRLVALIARSLLVLMLCVCCAGAQTQRDPWVAMAIEDLRGIHDGLMENHPGPVDPRNPDYRHWLEDGLAKAELRAKSAHSFADYLRALQFYTNGFKDGHVGVYPNVKISTYVWPGFLVAGTSLDDVHVAFADKDAGVTVGAKLLSCDGRSVDELVADGIDPYFWNSAIPHERYVLLYRLFYQDKYDTRPKLKTCRFTSGNVVLTWRQKDAAAMQEIINSARGLGARSPSLKSLDGVWMISLPSFGFEGDEIDRIKGLIAEVEAQAPILRRSTVLFDVRGNGGGDSAWGDQVVDALWGKGWAERVESTFDNSVDWRVSRANYEDLAQVVQNEEKAGLHESAAYWAKARDAIRDALGTGQDLVHVADPPHPVEGPLPANPVTGRVYVLTDSLCASACLDFLDVMRRLPGVTHVGLPTSADAIYIDSNHFPLPSGLSHLNYGMKVFRNRVRGNNVWYEPEIHWPGGEMTDESVPKWIASLP